MAIPKIIHYCWFGKQSISDRDKSFIEKWYLLNPSFEVKLWTEQNIPKNFEYLNQAQNASKFANMSNFVRLYALKKFGGIYLDSDVELMKPLDDFLLSKSCFFGIEEADENYFLVNNAIIGCEKNHWFINECFRKINYKFNGLEDANQSSPLLTTFTLMQYGLKQANFTQKLVDIDILSLEYFYPKRWYGQDNVSITNNTYAVHHYNLSWHAQNRKTSLLLRVKRKIASFLPEKLLRILLYGKVLNTLINSKTVLNGPFKGLTLINEEVNGSQLLPKILGTYEEVLHEWIYECQANNYINIINLGAGEGYYAIGFLKTFLLSGSCFAFEPDEKSVNILMLNLKNNKIDDKCIVSPSKFILDEIPAEILKDSFFFCDIEGGEAVLFTTDNASFFSKTDMIIELHEFIEPNIEKQIRLLFESSHEIEIRIEDQYNKVKNKVLAYNTPSTYLNEVIDEHRPITMKWMFLRSKNYTTL